MSYADALLNLFARSAKGMRLDLQLITALLARLGNPHHTFDTVIVAGTNGKGSTSALLAHALSQTSKRIGLYTSPHLLRFVERIRIGHDTISDAQVEAHYEQICWAERGLPRQATFFECATVMAFLAFEAASIDLAILEVGLGGRLDATNCAPDHRRLLTLITPIALDHQAYLGRTLTAIAGEKAGIMRRCVQAIAAPQTPRVQRALQNHAKAIGAPLRQLKQGSAARAKGLATRPQWPPYLTQNAELVSCALRQLEGHGYRLSPHQFQHALQTFQWPGRFTYLAACPPHRPAVLLDCAHNAAGARALAQALRQAPSLRNKRLVGLASVLEDKDLAGIIRAMRPVLSDLIFCGLDVARARSVKQLESYGTAYSSFTEAFASLVKGCGSDDVIVVFGSVFLVAQALSVLTGAQADPAVRG